MAVYQKALKLLYVDQLLERMKAEFVIHYDPQVQPHSHVCLAEARLAISPSCVGVAYLPHRI